MLPALKTAFDILRRRSAPKPFSMVLLMRKPFLQNKQLYCEAAERAFGVPYDGTEDMHFVEETPSSFLVKAGGLLVSIIPHWGAYLAKNGEDDAETGAALLPDEEGRWWRQQRAWVAFDVLNTDIAENDALQGLAKLLLEVVDERSCGVWLPHRGIFLPNDGRAISELTRFSQRQNVL